MHDHHHGFLIHLLFGSAAYHTSSKMIEIESFVCCTVHLPYLLNAIYDEKA